MKNEIEKPMEAQKKQRHSPAKISERKINVVELRSETIISEHANDSNLPKSQVLIVESFEVKANDKNAKEKPEVAMEKIENNDVVEEVKEKTIENKIIEPMRPIIEVPSAERVISEFDRAESPRPAPPVFDENFENEVVYAKIDRSAKEKAALELAQKTAYEQKVKEEFEMGEKKQTMNLLEDKFDNIASKYMKD